MSSKDNPIDDAVTKNVIEYYKKYSQNPDLPKYFSGSSVSYLPEFRENVNEGIPQIVIQTNLDVAIETEERIEPESVSRPSSAQSNRKLEWDYGADIGYDNCHNLKSLKKANSLPIIRDLNKKDLIGPNKYISSSKASSSGTKSGPDGNTKFVVFIHSDSESSSPAAVDLPVSSSATSTSVEEKKVHLSTTSSSGNIKDKPDFTSDTSSKRSDSTCKKNISEFASTLSYLKKKIGLPDAQSTPQSSDNGGNPIQKITETPVSSEPGKSVGNLKAILSHCMISSDSDLGKKSEVPRVSDVISEKRNRKFKLKRIEKSINLHLTKPVFVECISAPQDPPIKESIKHVKCATVAIQTDPAVDRELIQVVERHSIVENQAVEFCEHSDGFPNSAGTQTGSDLIESNCNSFQYLKNDEVQDKMPSKSTIEKNEVFPPTTSLREQPLSLGDFGDDVSISSGTFSDDIEKNAYILQKLLKSKKYDNTTKRRYVKKIVRKIIESKYLEESSNSSEMFLPKKDKTGLQQLGVPPSTNSSSKSVQDSNVASVYTPCSQCHSNSPRKRKQPVKHLLAGNKSAIYREENEMKGNHIKNLIVKDTEVFFDKYNKNKSSSSEPPQPSNSTVEKSYESTLSSSAKSDSKHLSYQNWKEDKTHSEHLFEVNGAITGDGDYFKDLAHQINRINNELDNLGKLKEILEKQEIKDKISQKNSKKFTSVYVVSDDNESTGKVKSDGKVKKYVIETNLAATLTSKRKFKIGDKKYSVTELTSASPSENKSDDSHVLGDIEVVSSEDTVNIKVTTFCQTCKRSPCVCNIAKSSKANGKTKESNTIESLTGTYISCLKTNNSAEASLAKVVKSCPLCNLYNCKCIEGTLQNVPSAQLLHKTPNTQSPSLSVESKKSGYAEYPSSGSGSLKKVFENCFCKSKSTCNCNFVNKLYEHFKIRTETNSYEVKKDNMAVQTEVDLMNAEIQTDILKASEISQQTENRREVASEATGVQCVVDMKHASSQISTSLVTQNTQTFDTPVENKGIDVNIDMKSKVNDKIDSQVSTLPKVLTKFQSQYQQTDLEQPYINIEQNKLLFEDKMVGDVAQGHDLKLMSTNGYLETGNIRSSQDKPSTTVHTMNKSTQNTPSVLNSSTSSTAISPYGNTASNSSSSSVVTCICCKKLTDKKHISIYHYDNENYAFCSKCVKKKPVLTSVCYTGPEYICQCSSSELDVPQKYCTCKKYVQHKNKEYCPYCQCKIRPSPPQPEKDLLQEYCTCIKPSQYKNTQYCAHCQSKLRKTLKSKHGIAYTLTLECDTPRKFTTKRKKKKELEEIKVKVPYPYSKKRHKDKENFDRKERFKPEISTNYVDDTNDSTNKESTIEDNKSTNETQKSETVTVGEDPEVQVKRILTLQEHLIKNRPEFIDSAEYRRHVLLNSKQDRELKKDDIKIRFLEENSFTIDRPKLFTEREMREITRNNYKKLPEVQQKLKNNREQVLRKADKFIVNKFTKKIQKSILKGKSTFPIDNHVVDMYK